MRARHVRGPEQLGVEPHQRPCRYEVCTASGRTNVMYSAGCRRPRRPVGIHTPSFCSTWPRVSARGAVGGGRCAGSAGTVVTVGDVRLGSVAIRRRALHRDPVGRAADGRRVVRVPPPLDRVDDAVAAVVAEPLDGAARRASRCRALHVCTYDTATGISTSTTTIAMPRRIHGERFERTGFGAGFAAACSRSALLAQFAAGQRGGRRLGRRSRGRDVVAFVHRDAPTPSR